MDVHDYIKELVDTYKYRPLPKNLSSAVRDIFFAAIPEHFNVAGDNISLKTTEGTVFATGYDRIVIGDYGAYIEIAKKDMIDDILRTAPGQEYRILDPRFKDNVKYHWLTTKDASGLKFYWQRKTVKYADYKPDFGYVSVFECFPC